MFLSLKQCRKKSIQILLVCLAVVSCYSVAMSQAQSNAADLQGVVRDPKGAVVAGAAGAGRDPAPHKTRGANTKQEERESGAWGKRGEIRGGRVNLKKKKRKKIILKC